MPGFKVYPVKQSFCSDLNRCECIKLESRGPECLSPCAISSSLLNLHRKRGWYRPLPEDLDHSSIPSGESGGLYIPFIPAGCVSLRSHATLFMTRRESLPPLTDLRCHRSAYAIVHRSQAGEALQALRGAPPSTRLPHHIHGRSVMAVWPNVDDVSEHRSLVLVSWI